MTQFQSSINVFNPLGFVGGFAFQGPTRAIAANVNSSGTPNLFGNAYTFTSPATASPTGGSENGATVTVGGTGVFAGILFQPKENVLTGVTGNPLGATLALADNSVGELLQMGYGFVNLPGPANPGDLVTYDPATGNLNTIPPAVVFAGTIAAGVIGVSAAVLTVTTVTTGALAVGQLISGVGLEGGLFIAALGTGKGNTGTYTLSSDTQPIITPALAMTAVSVPAPALSITATFATNVMTVASVVSGTVRVGDQIFGAGIPANTVVTSLGTGVGGTGTYNLNQTVGTITPAIAITGPTNILVPRCTVERYAANATGGVAVIKLTN